ncbi:SHOCT domain-containing protein [Leptospira fluminis]|uniref:SHOCT domain-containing protein n=1 Tax=Leptospira fluminis TaxID=2484979 RepID=A0A4R9GU88_9LEPT|nr:SHOCT domain-containing protein [Leptospira fluminis]
MATSLKKAIRIKKIRLSTLPVLLSLALLSWECLSAQRKEMATLSDSAVLFYIHKSRETPDFLEPETWLPLASTVLREVHFDSDEKAAFLQRWESLFKYLGVSDNIVGVKEPIRLFTEEESRILGELLYKAEKEIPDGSPKAYQIILKREDQLRPGLRIRRTVFYLRNRADCMLFEFGEIGQVVDFQTAYALRDWILFPIREPETSPTNSVFLPEVRPVGLEYAESIPNRNAVKNRLCVRPNFWTEKKLSEPESVPKTKSPKDAADRLKVLKDLLEKRLITKEEYERKKAEILKDL